MGKDAWLSRALQRGSQRVTELERQVQEIRDSTRVVYESENMRVCSFSLPKRIKAEIEAALSSQKPRWQRLLK